MTAFSIEAASRSDALDLLRRLGHYSPWLLELTQGRWYVRGALGGSSYDDLHAVLDRWADERSARVPPVAFVDASGGGPANAASKAS